MLAVRRAAGLGNELKGASKNPVSTAHQTMPWPPSLRGAHGVTAGQEDLTAELVEFLGDLASRLTASDHQHRTRRRLRGFR